VCPSADQLIVELSKAHGRNRPSRSHRKVRRRFRRMALRWELGQNAPTQLTWTRSATRCACRGPRRAPSDSAACTSGTWSSRVRLCAPGAGPGQTRCDSASKRKATARPWTFSTKFTPPLSAAQQMQAPCTFVAFGRPSFSVRTKLRATVKPVAPVLFALGNLAPCGVRRAVPTPLPQNLVRAT
jgi:hypothetical protein